MNPRATDYAMDGEHLRRGQNGGRKALQGRCTRPIQLQRTVLRLRSDNSISSSRSLTRHRDSHGECSLPTPVDSHFGRVSQVDDVPRVGLHVSRLIS